MSREQLIYINYIDMCSISVVKQVCIIMVQLFHLKALGHQNLQVLLIPLLSGQILQEEKSILK